LPSADLRPLHTSYSFSSVCPFRIALSSLVPAPPFHFRDAMAPAFMLAAPVGASSFAASSPSRSARCARRASAPPAVAMAIDAPGITLQTLLYSPSSTPSSVGDVDVLCRLIVQQVFGNAYVMESERADFYKAESMYRAGLITVRDFVRAIALSETYRRRFFQCVGPYRYVELAYKHLLGRGPNSQAEVSEHVRRLQEDGYEADVNSFIDSPEYEARFGDDYVPGIMFKGTYASSEEFNRMCSIYSSPGTTDKSLTVRAVNQGTANPNHVLSLDGAGIPSKTVALASLSRFATSAVRIKKAIPSRPDMDHGINVGASLIRPSRAFVNADSAPRTRVEIAMGNYMYLTAAEAAQVRATNNSSRQAASAVASQVSSAKAEIARLQARIAALSAAV
jgi:phycoerythrin-associated linker protein